jgi:hypothetical protein
VDGDAARRVLGDDLEALAKPFVGDGAVEGDGAVLNLDSHARGAQSSFSNSAWMAALISASECGPVARGVAASNPLSRSERAITPTTV